MSLLPIFLNLESRPGLLVGAGTVALEKIGSLLKTGVKLRVVAPQARPEVRRLAAEGKLEWVERDFQPSDLDGNFIVIAATDVPKVNAAVYRDPIARERRYRWMQPLAAALPHAVNIYQFPQASEVTAILDLDLNRAVAGEITAADALNSMSEQIYAVMAKYDYKTGKLPPLR